MFKRRKPRSYSQLATEMIYPRGGWRRASQYVMHRIRRLPDQPQRIARGFAAGLFVSFTPFFGFHFMMAALVAWIIRGNIVAALLGTFVGNPLTFPFIAVLSVTLGRRMLDVEGTLQPPAEGAAWEYSVVLSIRNERGDEVTGQVVGVGAMQPHEQRSFVLSVELNPATGKSAGRRTRH